MRTSPERASRRWTAPTGRSAGRDVAGGPLALRDGSLYVAPGDVAPSHGTVALRAFDADEGTERWANDAVHEATSVLVADGTVFAVTALGRVVALAHVALARVRPHDYYSRYPSGTMRGLAGTTALVTGAGGGIGGAIADRLADEGATVAVNDVDAERAGETVERIESAGGEAFPAVADVTDLDAVYGMVDDVAGRAGLDVLVNNAGWDRIEWFLEQDPARWDRIVDVNYRGQVNCARAVAESMVERDVDGSLVAVASDAGRVGSTGEAVYAGTKGGVIAFTKTLARELARYGINCNVVSPGPTETPMAEAMFEDSELAVRVFDAMADRTPLGRLTEPEDVAGVVAFLASEDASFVTGQVLSVSGGLTMVD